MLPRMDLEKTNLWADLVDEEDKLLQQQMLQKVCGNHLQQTIGNVVTEEQLENVELNIVTTKGGSANIHRRWMTLGCNQ